MSKIIQLMHPGGYSYNEGNISWNNKGHKRKLIKNEISYIDNGVLCKNKIGYFWGEWEPESYCLKENGYYVHTVKYPSDIESGLLNKCVYGCNEPADYRNTDPYVFGDYFIYSNCLQSYSELQQLGKDDLILFGSSVDGNFVLDTLFVVDKELYPDEIVSDCFKKTTYQFIKDEDVKIYKAKMYNSEDPEYIYSLFPCSLNPFERPEINLEYISKTKRGVYYIHKHNPNLKSKEVWNQIVDIIKSKVLFMGVSATEPKEY